ncbi:MAG TPA: CcmD family protein [Gaiellaceae bacterium]|nr:CcmD family protein [Gaiellaceae bacterium]
MTAEEKYVAAAYLVVFLFVLVYVVIMAAKLSRLGREVAELVELVRGGRRDEHPDAGPERERREVGVG